MIKGTYAIFEEDLRRILQKQINKIYLMDKFNKFGRTIIDTILFDMWHNTKSHHHP